MEDTTSGAASAQGEGSGGTGAGSAGGCVPDIIFKEGPKLDAEHAKSEAQDWVRSFDRSGTITGRTVTGRMTSTTASGPEFQHWPPRARPESLRHLAKTVGFSDFQAQSPVADAADGAMASEGETSSEGEKS